MFVIPNFRADGLLPVGEHASTWAELTTRFDWRPHRLVLLDGLRAACLNLAAGGCQRLWLDGSFVTSKQIPADYDACWDPQGVDPLLLDPCLLDFTPGGRLRMKAKYLGDLFVAGIEGRTSQPFVEFFQLDRSGERKGIVVVDLETVT